MELTTCELRRLLPSLETVSAAIEKDLVSNGLMRQLRRLTSFFVLASLRLSVLPRTVNGMRNRLSGARILLNDVRQR